MKFIISDIADNPVNALRRIGYTFQRRENNELSFVRPLASSGYPRFHLYIRNQGNDLSFNFHLDQKRETYGDDTRHHGEYEESEALNAEANRIKSAFTSNQTSSEVLGSPV